MINLHYHDNVAHIALDDGKANAVSFAFIDAFNEALDQIDANDDAKAIVISGRDGMFSAGFDLKVMMNEPERAMEMVANGGKLFLRLFQHPLPTIAAMTGHSMAAGILLAMSCDTRIAAEGNYKIGLNETAIGMVLPHYGLELAKARIAPHRLTEAFVQARLYSPEEAVPVGYVDRVTSPDKVVEESLALAAQATALPGAAYAGNKLLIRQPFIDAIAKSLGVS
ncbi:MAG: crotonase/enoyl-CoA hydratase family protein [Alphaproteobacteria bacterium]